MPVPESRKAIFDRQRWRRPGFSIQQLRLLVLVLLAAGVAVQGYFFIRDSWKELLKVRKTIGQSTAWRSANYSYGKDLADFVVFIQQRVPEDGTVIWPGSGFAARLPGATAMQALLYPRRLLQCPATGCEDMKLDEKTFFVVAGTFPGERIARQAVQSDQFNARWGILTFDAVGFGDYAASTQFQSLYQALLAALLPVGWMLLLAACGTVIASILLPQADFYMKAALGFGLGMGVFTMAAGLVALAGISLRPPVLLGIAAVMAAGAVLALRLVRLEQPGNRQETSSRIGTVALVDHSTLQDGPGEITATTAGAASGGKETPGTYQEPSAARIRTLRLDGWVLVFAGLAVVSALLAVGKGYSISDELLIWAPKGYGIAASGTLASVTGWGTNTLPYPLHVPILVAAFNLLFGDILPAAKLVFSAYYLALLVLAYSFLRETGLRLFAAGCCSLLVATAPLVFRHSTIAYANLVFSFNLLSAAILLARAVEHPAHGRAGRIFFLSGLFFMLAAWTRPEGLWMAWLLVGSMAAYSVFRRRRLPWKDWAWLAAPLLFYQLYWWLVNQSAYRVGIERSQIGIRAAQAVLAGSLHLPEGAYLLASGIKRLLDFENWGIWGASLLFLALFGLVWWWRRGGGGQLVFLQGWLTVGMVMAMYYIASYDSSHDISWWVSTGLERMLLPGLLLLWLGGIQLVNNKAGSASAGPTGRGDGDTGG